MTEMDATTSLSFEDALKRLEGIVAQLERGDVPLEQAIALYEEGNRLRARCQDRLEAAQARIQQITFSADGAPAGTRPFAED
jgi:exodeoxyribonuclease VII small subunit